MSFQTLEGVIWCNFKFWLCHGQSGASESATVCFVTSLSIFYWLLKCKVLLFVCVFAFVREGDTVTQPRLVCKHIRASLLCLSRDCSTFGLELMVKLRTLLTVLTLVLKAEARDYGKGSYISDAACGVRPITMSVGQSKQTMLFGRRDFVENKAFERSGA